MTAPARTGQAASKRLAPEGRRSEMPVPARGLGWAWPVPKTAPSAGRVPVFGGDAPTAAALFRLRGEGHRPENVAGRIVGQDELGLAVDDRTVLRLEADHVADEGVGRDAPVAAVDVPRLGEGDRIFDHHVVL